MESSKFPDQVANCHLITSLLRGQVATEQKGGCILVGIAALRFADKRLCLSGGDTYSVILPVKSVACIFREMVISWLTSRAAIYSSGSMEGPYMEIAAKDVKCHIFLL